MQISYGFEEFRAAYFGSGPRFAYKEPAPGASPGPRFAYKEPIAGTSVVGVIVERGWKFVFPTNQ